MRFGGVEVLLLTSFFCFGAAMVTYNEFFTYLGIGVFIVGLGLAVRFYGGVFVHRALMNGITYAILASFIITFIAAFVQDDYSIVLSVNVVGEAYFEFLIIIYYVGGLAHAFANKLTLKWGVSDGNRRIG